MLLRNFQIAIIHPVNYRIGNMFSNTMFQLHDYSTTPNFHMVVVLYVSPGLRTTLGKFF
jgi:hypothetical protein